MKDKPYQLIKIFIIIGIVLTGLTSFFIGFAWSIPLGIIGLQKVKEAKTKSDNTSWGIIILFLVSLIAGILILAGNEQDYIAYDQKPIENEEQKN